VLGLALLVSVQADAVDTSKIANALAAAKRGDARGDFTAALAILMPLAEQGNAEAQARLGVMRETGEGLIQDYSAAIAWYQRAAEQGDPTAQNNLGMMYARGLGVRKNYVEGHKWVNLAARQRSEATPLRHAVRARTC